MGDIPPPPEWGMLVVACDWTTEFRSYGMRRGRGFQRTDPPLSPPPTVPPIHYPGNE